MREPSHLGGRYMGIVKLTSPHHRSSNQTNNTQHVASSPTISYLYRFHLSTIPTVITVGPLPNAFHHSPVISSLHTSTITHHHHTPLHDGTLHHRPRPPRRKRRHSSRSGTNQILLPRLSRSLHLRPQHWQRTPRSILR